MLIVIAPLFYGTDAESSAAYIWSINNYLDPDDCLDPILWIYNLEFLSLDSRLINNFNEYE